MSVLVNNVRACACRFISRYQVTTFSAVRNANQSLRHSLSRSCTSLTEGNNSHTVKVSTGKDSMVQKHIDLYFMGRDGTNLKRLNLECEIKVRDGFVSVSGPDAEVVENIAQKVSQEVKTIINQRGLPFFEKVMTDEQVEIHKEICANFIGEGGENVMRLRLETGLNFEYEIPCAGHILISGTNAEVVKIVTEKIQQEVQRIRNENILPFSEKVVTDEDEAFHSMICAMIIGKEGENLRKLCLETGLNFELKSNSVGYVLVSGTDAEVVKKATERIQQEVQRIRNKKILPFSEKVMTDEDEAFHSLIHGYIIGKGGENLKKLRLETGLSFDLELGDIGHVLVSGTDAEVVKIATERIQQEVQRIRNEKILPFSEKVVTDEDEAFHVFICGNIIGKGGENLRKLRLETGLNFDLETDNVGHVLVLGADAEVVKIATERIQQEVQRIRNEKILPFSEKLVTDEDEAFHDYICGNIIGKGGENLRKLHLETGLNFDLETDNVGHVLVSGVDAEVVKNATERIQQEVQRIRNEKILPFSEKLVTDEDEAIHDYICGNIIGKGGENLNKLCLETGLNFGLKIDDVGHILVLGADAEVVKIATERIQQEVQRIRNEKILPFSEKLVTDEDEAIHDYICGNIIGKGGENLRKLRLETGLNFELETDNVGHILVLGADTEVVKIATEKVQQEVQRIRNEKILPFSEKVVTDEDEAFHDMICAMIIGKGGENLRKLRLETGLNFDLETGNIGHILVLGADTEVVKIATEKVQQEVQRIRNEKILPFSEKVVTDED
ncbi:vigilin-like [Mizuhopecten yessoensis]|uniref:vigilin-like n=1 Tax=Mizuhopecten yessoensis TaxID=6573 RepID=UPI000B45B709|nr:vigilin-like [Mizuhopecten yessoensis]